MPMDYYCERCGLVFSTGVFGVRSRYPGRRFLVCRSCGTCHQLQEPMNQKHPLRFLALSGPLVRKDKPSRPTLLNRNLKWRLLDVPMSQLESSVASEDFAGIACSSCQSLGSLTGEWKPGEKRCPKCGEETLTNTGGWIT